MIPYDARPGRAAAGRNGEHRANAIPLRDAGRLAPDRRLFLAVAAGLTLATVAFGLALVGDARAADKLAGDQRDNFDVGSSSPALSWVRVLDR